MPIHTVARHKVSVEEVVTALQCNVCGVVEPRREDGVLPNDMHAIRLSGGWGDNYPGDMETLTFVVHGTCLRAWTSTFQVEPESKHSMGTVPPIPCTHSETGEAMILQWGWMRKASEPFHDPKIEDPYSLPHTDQIPGNGIVACGIFEHFKGRLYQVIDHGWDVNEPHEAYVVYRALYGDSTVFARPARMWSEQVDRDGYSGPRFRLKYGVDGAPSDNKFKEPE